MAHMIRTYNRKQFLLGTGCLFVGVIGYACAWLFFRHLMEYVLDSFGFRVSVGTIGISTVVILLLVTVSGYRLWRRGGGFQSYHESGLYHELDLSSGGAYAADFYAHRITGPAFLLTQVFLAGPLMTLRGITHFRNRIPMDDSLDHSLRETLARLQGLNKWQSLHEHPGSEKSILLLAKMGRIDFSSARGPRFRAYPDNHKFPGPSGD